MISMMIKTTLKNTITARAIVLVSTLSLFPIDIICSISFVSAEEEVWNSIAEASGDEAISVTDSEIVATRGWSSVRI